MSDDDRDAIAAAQAAQREALAADQRAHIDADDATTEMFTRISVHPEAFDAVLPDSFYGSRPELLAIRQAARARLCGPDAVLVGCIARAIALVEPNVVLPPIVGGVGSLNVLGAIVAPSGGGKSTASDVAGEIVDTTTLALNERAAGSGEGLIEAFLEARKDDDGKIVGKQVISDPRALYWIDEGELLMSTASRRGSTIMQVLRTAWSGGKLESNNASQETRRSVGAHSYRFAALVGFQPSKAVALLEDVDGGTPQRFLWASALDPGVPDLAPAWPGKLPLHFSPPIGLRQEMYKSRNYYVVDVAQSIVDELQQRQRNINAGRLSVNPLDSHEGLVRLKTAFGLARLNGRWNISVDDWALAGVMIDTSVNVRSQIVTKHRESELEEQRRRGDLAAERRLTADQRQAEAANDQLEKDVSKIAELVLDGPMTVGYISQKMGGRGNKTARRDHAIKEGVNRGLFTTTVLPTGAIEVRTSYPGDLRPNDLTTVPPPPPRRKQPVQAQDGNTSDARSNTIRSLGLRLGDNSNDDGSGPLVSSDSSVPAVDLSDVPVCACGVALVSDSPRCPSCDEVGAA